ncbi:MAG: 50S ribosomal protein L17 [Patescibacteria group bacterium]
MRHQKKGRKFHRTKGKRESFLINLSCDLIRHGRIETTEARAKEIRPLVEKLVTLAKRRTIANLRLILRKIKNKKAAGKIYDEIAPRYAERFGGYLRITKTSKSRKRDGSRLASIEFV